MPQQTISPTQLVTVLVEREHFLVNEVVINLLDELVATLNGMQAHAIYLHIGPSAEGDFQRIGKVVYALNRYGFMVQINDGRGEGV